MVEKILVAYKKIYDKDFEITNFDSKKQMQKAVFILSLSGMTFENYYGYIWDEYGPYSSELADDLKIYFSVDNNCEYDFNERDTFLIEKFKEMIEKFSKKTNYSIMNIVEAKASIMFLKEVNINLSNDEILSELFVKKPHLNDTKTNRAILEFNF